MDEKLLTVCTESGRLFSAPIFEVLQMVGNGDLSLTDLVRDSEADSWITLIDYVSLNGLEVPPPSALVHQSPIEIEIIPSLRKVDPKEKGSIYKTFYLSRNVKWVRVILAIGAAIGACWVLWDWRKDRKAALQMQEQILRETKMRQIPDMWREEEARQAIQDSLDEQTDLLKDISDSQKNDKRFRPIRRRHPQP